MKLSKKEHERIVSEQIRNDILGGSDAAAAIGLSKWKTPLQLAQEKLGLVKLFQGNRFTEAGKRLEDVIARWYADETGSKVARVNRTLKLDGYPYIVAHVDRRVVGKRKVLECKSADKWTIANWGDPGSEDVPDEYFIQVQHYLLFKKYFDHADLAALIGGNDFRIYQIAPDSELQDMMLQGMKVFWDTIQRGDLPDPVNSADADRRWSRDTKDAVYADADVLEWHHELKRSQGIQKEIEQKIDQCKLQIKQFMTEHQVLLDGDGKKLHAWKEQALSGFREDALLEENPEVYEACRVEKFDRNICRSKYPHIYKQYQKMGRVFR